MLPRWCMGSGKPYMMVGADARTVIEWTASTKMQRIADSAAQRWTGRRQNKLSVTKRDAIAHMIAQLDITERCIAGAEDPKARAILENSAESFRMAIAAMQGTLPSNADRIRAMSDEELAVFLERATGGCETCANVCSCNGTEELPPKSMCHQGVLEWLRKPAEEEPA